MQIRSQTNWSTKGSWVCSFRHSLRIDSCAIISKFNCHSISCSFWRTDHVYQLLHQQTFVSSTPHMTLESIKGTVQKIVDFQFTKVRSCLNAHKKLLKWTLNVFFFPLHVWSVQLKRSGLSKNETRCSIKRFPTPSRSIQPSHPGHRTQGFSQWINFNSGSIAIATPDYRHMNSLLNLIPKGAAQLPKAVSVVLSTVIKASK